MEDGRWKINILDGRWKINILHGRWKINMICAQWRMNTYTNNDKYRERLEIHRKGNKLVIESVL